MAQDDIFSPEKGMTAKDAFAAAIARAQNTDKLVILAMDGAAKVGVWPESTLRDVCNEYLYENFPNHLDETRSLKVDQAAMDRLTGDILDAVVAGGAPGVVEWLAYYAHCAEMPGLDPRKARVRETLEKAGYTTGEAHRQDVKERGGYTQKIVGTLVSALEGDRLPSGRSAANWLFLMRKRAEKAPGA